MRWICTLSLVGMAWAALALVRLYWFDQPSDGWFQQRVGAWRERTFPPREKKRARGFEVKLQAKQNTGETPVPLDRKDNDHG